MTTFKDLQVDSRLVAQLTTERIETPSKIQEAAIPVALEGKDVIAQSQTGTGKTLAYLIPMLQRIQPDLKQLQGLILAPTQELAMQIFREADNYGQTMGITVQSLIGGAASKRQLEKLKLHPQLIVGTPGRVLEMIRNRKVKMHEVRTITVDEVDQMFKLGAAGDTEAIFKTALRDRQLLFFSATMPAEVRDIADAWMREPVEIGIETDQKTSATIEHYYFETEERNKIDTLRRIVRLYKPKSAIVFVNDIASIAEWVAKLQYLGLSVEPLYGEADKQERANVLRRFREGQVQLLLATDVAARGLDIKELPMVINFDLPISSEHYVHRVGRTGRMGHQGMAISISTPREQFIIEKFNRQLGIHITPQAMYDGKVLSRESEDRPVRKPVAKPTHKSTTARAASKPTVQTAGNQKNSKSKLSRDKDRKNAGAPKWLKAKTDPK
ncbi:DEAD/DEAH box helicase [Paenibacillus selenitireducens]|uniref:DEAD/DEAH box helicase n=1 Tax=Paenibacillus selenitireducens TaxID=1324314 RepID=A0A1T2XK41_9BACL|nr:DEAD/DEAH box helicase [Paenibacillus selenitireducens]OPA80086.1 DEAD/DEAH box helicase [Paenibacillus selenitireducens]